MYLIPTPVSVKEEKGNFTICYDAFVCIPGNASLRLRNQILRFVKVVKNHLGFELSVTTDAPKPGDLAVYLKNDSEGEGYKLDCTGENIVISGGEKGVFYGFMTLLQMIESKGAVLPKVLINDYPDIPNRGYYLDASRGRIPTLDWLKNIVDKLAYYKLNQLQLYIEHTYLFRNISELWRDDTPLTAAEILELDSYCAERNIELVPSLSSFGHLFKLLSTKTYSHLSELSNAAEIPFSVLGRMNHHTINVRDKESHRLIKSMIKEYMGLFTSKQFNICADETFDLGRDKNKKYVEKHGKERLYIDFVKELANFIIALGSTPMFWGDIIVGFPEMLKELPKEIICLNWGYGWNQREYETKTLAKAGATMYCCPGCCGWNQLVNLYDYSYSNIKLMTKYARKHKAIGILNTDWGDFLHINHPAFSLPGMIYGAAFSWNKDVPDFETVNKMISKMEFKDNSESLLSIVSQTKDMDAFTWNLMCRYKDVMEDLTWYMPNNKAYINEFISSMEGVNKKSKTISKLEEKLYGIIASVEDDHKPTVYAYIIAVKGMRLFNELGKIVVKKESGKSFTGLANPKELAKELEMWLYHYKEVYRSVSKEGELSRIQDLICFYADYLRTKA